TEAPALPAPRPPAGISRHQPAGNHPLYDRRRNADDGILGDLPLSGRSLRIVRTTGSARRARLRRLSKLAVFRRGDAHLPADAGAALYAPGAGGTPQSSGSGRLRALVLRPAQGA